jgi:hypothetical protein
MKRVRSSGGGSTQEVLAETPRANMRWIPFCFDMSIATGLEHERTGVGFLSRSLSSNAPGRVGFFDSLGLFYLPNPHLMVTSTISALKRIAESFRKVPIRYVSRYACVLVRTRTGTAKNETSG